MDKKTSNNMLKQSPSRNQKSRGSGTKQVFQISLVLAICIWLIYQSKQLYGNKVVVAVQGRRLMKDNAQEMLILGRKNLNPQLVAEHHQDVDLDLEDENGFDPEKPEEGEHEQLDDLIDEDDKEE